jgi:hypothetical protein
MLFFNNVRLIMESTPTGFNSVGTVFGLGSLRHDDQRTGSPLLHRTDDGLGVNDEEDNDFFYNDEADCCLNGDIRTEDKRHCNNQHSDDDY